MKRELPQVRRKQLFFSVTLEANIPNLKISIPLINRYYNIPKFVVICPASSLNRFTRIRFFDAAGNYSFQYGSLSEFNQPYFDTLKNVLPGLPTRFLACTIQFFSCSKLEQDALVAHLSQLHPRPANQPWAHWISEIMIDAVLKTHGAFSGPLFSEQELVGLSNMLTHPSRQVPLKHLRWGVEGRLSNAQLMPARVMGFLHLTYENPNALLSQSQGWKSLVQLMHKESRHFYRSR